MQEALAAVERLLRSYGHTYEANLAEIALNQYTHDPVAACRSINNAEWWDSSRSVASVDLAVSGGFTRQSRRDAMALREALIEVLNTMQRFGQRNPTGELVAAQFRKWLDSHA